MFLENFYNMVFSLKMEQHLLMLLEFLLVDAYSSPENNINNLFSAKPTKLGAETYRQIYFYAY